MTTRSDVAIVTTNLAQTDRRALSEAWFSALHLAGSVPEAHVVAHAQAVPSGAVAAAHATHEAAAAPNALGPRASSRNVRTATLVALPERRRPLPAPARTVERTIATLAQRRSATAARTVVVDGGRVRILVRSDERAVRIVAVCCEAQRPDVERALAHARFALAAHGAPLG